MSLEPDRPPQSPRTLGQIFLDVLPQKHPLEDAVAALERENQALKDARLEERFCWILAATILFDMAIFANIQTVGVPLAILGLELLLIVVLARKCGVQQIVLFIDRVVDGLTKRSSDQIKP